ncbi:hypothetical protein SUGI_0591400 [Cryptomeria japonica]|nr:hypothetical protein SUGI_0591400 [Cryptomeria japonica]
MAVHYMDYNVIRVTSGEADADLYHLLYPTAACAKSSSALAASSLQMQQSQSTSEEGEIQGARPCLGCRVAHMEYMPCNYRVGISVAEWKRPFSEHISDEQLAQVFNTHCFQYRKSIERIIDTRAPPQQTPVNQDAYGQGNAQPSFPDLNALPRMRATDEADDAASTSCLPPAQEIGAPQEQHGENEVELQAMEEKSIDSQFTILLILW